MPFIGSLNPGPAQPTNQYEINLSSFSKFVSIFNYGDGFKKLTDVMSFFEVLMKAYLQSFLQGCIMLLHLYEYSRRQSKAQLQSFLISLFSSILLITKSYMPSKIMSSDYPLKEKIMKTIWFAKLSPSLHYSCYVNFAFLIVTCFLLISPICIVHCLYVAVFSIL